MTRSQTVPYCYDRPIDDPDLFVGRGPLVDDMAARVRRGESFAVLGGTRIGKTTLFQQVKRALDLRPETPSGQRIVPVLLSAQQFGRLSRSAIFSAILDELRGAVDEAVAADLGDAIRELRAGDEDYAFDLFTSALRDAMRRDEEFALFILLDEVDELRQHDWSKTFFGNHRFLISQSEMRQRVSLMIAGTLSSASLWNTAGSPFYNVVTIVELVLLADDELRALIPVGFPQGLPGKVEADLLAEVGGHPYLMQYFLSRIWESGTDGDPVAEAGRRFSKERRGDFQRWWGACGEDARPLFGQIAHATEPFKKHAAIEIFGDVDRVERALDQLLVNGLVREVDTNRFLPGSRLFARWALQRLTPDTVPTLASVAAEAAHTGPLPERFADLRAIWDGRQANYAQLTPAFYRRMGEGWSRIGEPWRACDTYDEALDRWPQPGHGFATRLADALTAGRSPGRASALIADRRRIGYDDPVLEPLPAPRGEGRVVAFVGPAQEPQDSPAEPAELLELIQHLVTHGDARYGYCSAAAGAEILFAEALLRRGGDLHLVLPCSEDVFRESRVHPAWRSRFDQVRKAAATVDEMGGKEALQNRASLDYTRRITLGHALFRASATGCQMTAVAAHGHRDDGVGATLAWWRARELDVRELGRGEASTAHPPAQSERQHRLVGLLFADTARFSQLDDVQLRRFADHYLGKIAELVDRSQHAPVVKNTWGDGLYMVFLDVGDAGLFALELSELFHDIDWKAAGMPADLRTRVGLHAGPTHSLTDPLTGQFTFMGAHVSRAARIEQITPPGTVYCSRAFAALVAAEGIEDFGCEYAGRIALPKDFGTFGIFHLVPA